MTVNLAYPFGTIPYELYNSVYHVMSNLFLWAWHVVHVCYSLHFMGLKSEKYLCLWKLDRAIYHDRHGNELVDHAFLLTGVLTFCL